MFAMRATVLLELSTDEFFIAARKAARGHRKVLTVIVELFRGAILRATIRLASHQQCDRNSHRAADLQSGAAWHVMLKNPVITRCFCVIGAACKCIGDRYDPARRNNPNRCVGKGMSGQLPVTELWWCPRVS